MRVTCTAYSARSLPNGEIELTMQEGKPDPIEENLNLDQVAALIGKTKRAVDKLSRRMTDPLPLHRGKGRPFGLRSEICEWLASSPRTGLQDFMV